jgi:hypothetical protein
MEAWALGGSGGGGRHKPAKEPADPSITDLNPVNAVNQKALQREGKGNMHIHQLPPRLQLPSAAPPRPLLVLSPRTSFDSTPSNGPLTPAGFIRLEGSREGRAETKRCSTSTGGVSASPGVAMVRKFTAFDTGQGFDKTARDPRQVQSR